MRQYTPFGTLWVKISIPLGKGRDSLIGSKTLDNGVLVIIVCIHPADEN